MKFAMSSILTGNSSLLAVILFLAVAILTIVILILVGYWILRYALRQDLKLQRKVQPDSLPDENERR